MDPNTHRLQESATACVTVKLGADSDPDFAAPNTDATIHVQVQVGGAEAAKPRGVNQVQRIAGYEILEELGRGGMGVVYKGWQHSLQRPVALKMILAGSFAGPEDLDRFRAEAMAIARLHHPHLLSIYEIGETNQLPFYAMEYMEGGSLARRLNGQAIAGKVAAELVRNLAQAMDFAHKNGIVHRDLKPANILLAGETSTPLDHCVAKVTDFGIAKQLDGDSNYTRTGDILGTPNYMAPEQAMGQRERVGPAADVYSLGAILYELLTGRPPFQGNCSADVLLALTKDEPVRPSQRQPTTPRDLETICLKCLEKDPDKRYGSAADLADDLDRYLHNEPIRARPASLSDRAVKWTRRRPALAAILLMAGCLMLLSFVMLTLMWRQAVDHASRQDELLTRSKELLADAYLDRGIHLAEKGDVRRGMHWMLRSLEVTAEAERRQNAPSDLEPIIRMNLQSWGQCVSSREAALPHRDWVWDVAFSPNQPVVVTASKDRRVQAWHALTGKAIGEPLAHPFPVWGVAFHPDGATLFTVCGDFEHGLGGWVCAWIADPREPGRFMPRGTPLMLPFDLVRLCINIQGDRLWVGDRTGLALLLAFDPHAAGSGLRIVCALPGRHQLPAFSPDGAALATVSGHANDDASSFVPGGQVQVWDARTGAARGEPLEHKGPARTVLFSKDSKHLIVGSAAGPIGEQGETSIVQVWNLDSRACVARTEPLPGRIKASALSANGNLLATSLFEYVRAKEPGRIHITDGQILLWQLGADGAIESFGTPLRTHHVVWHMEFSPDSRLLLAGCENSGAFLWSVSNCQRMLAPIWHEGNCVKVAFSKDGRNAVTASAGGGRSASARLWEVPRFGHIGPLLSQPAGVRSAYWDSDGKHAWICSGLKHLRWDPLLGEKVEDITLPRFAYYAYATSDPNRVLVEFGDNQTRVFERTTKSATNLPGLLQTPAPTTNLDYHAKKEIFIRSWARPSKIQLINIDGTPASPLIAERKYELTARLLSPDAEVLAVAQSILEHTNRLLIYNTRDMSVRFDLPMKHSIRSLGFSPDGRTLLFGGRDRQVQRLDIRTGKNVGAPLLHEGIIQWIGHLASDRILATCSDKGLILLWDVKTGKRIGPAFEHRADLVSIAVHPQGKYLLTATHGKMAMSWQVPDPMSGSLEEIRAWVAAMTGMELSEHDTVAPLDNERQK